MADIQIPLRITLMAPPAGVLYALQAGKNKSVFPARSVGADLSFDVSLKLAGQQESGAPRFTGDFAQGPASERFVYILIGTSAGDRLSPWTRRLKIHVSGITWELVEEVQAKPGSVLAARFTGTDKKGEPTCASQRPLEPGWRVIE